MTLFGTKSVPLRFAIAFPIGCVLYLAIRWAFFGKPTSASIPGMIAGAFIFALLVAFQEAVRSR